MRKLVLIPVLLTFIAVQAQNKKGIDKIASIDRMVTLINTSPLVKQLEMVSPRFDTNSYFKAQYCINTVATNLIKINENNGIQAETLKQETAYYFIDSELIKVEQLTTPPSGDITVKTELYYNGSKPLTRQGRPNKALYKDFLKKSDDLLFCLHLFLNPKNNLLTVACT